MPLVLDDEEKNNYYPMTSTSPGAHATAAPGTVAPVIGGGGSGFAGNGGGSGAATNVAAGGGGGYTNLSQYLAANQDTGATTGKAAANVVQQQANQAQDAQKTYADSADAEINNAAAKLGVNQGVLDRIKGGAAKLDPAYLKAINAGINAQTGVYTAPTTQPTIKYTGPSMKDVQVSYGGPSSTGNFSKSTMGLQDKAIGANALTNAYANQAKGDESDVAGLLKSAYAQPKYTQGENNLDSFLAGGVAGGRSALNSVSGLGDSTNKAYTDLNRTFTGKIGNAGNIAKDTNKAYQDAINAASSDPNGVAAGYKTAIADAIAKTKADHDKLTTPVQVDNNSNVLTNPGGTLTQVSNPLAKLIGHPVNVGKQIAGAGIAGTKQIANQLGSGNLSGALNTAGSDPWYAGAGILAGGLSSLDKDIGGVSNPIKTSAINSITNPPNPIKSVKSIPGFAHGGEVPSYAELEKYLRAR